MLALVLASCWVLANDHWAKIDRNDPGKVLVLNMAQSMKPPLEFIAQRRNALAERGKKRLEQLRGESSALETRS
jgi:hypothetical protein